MESFDAEGERKCFRYDSQMRKCHPVATRAGVECRIKKSRQDGLGKRRRNRKRLARMGQCHFSEAFTHKLPKLGRPHT